LRYFSDPRALASAAIPYTNRDQATTKSKDQTLPVHRISNPEDTGNLPTYGNGSKAPILNSCNEGDAVIAALTEFTFDSDSEPDEDTIVFALQRKESR
jgi:hypothetical protein